MPLPQSSWSGGGRNIFRDNPVTVVILGLLVLGFLATLIAPADTLGLLAYIPFHLPNMISGVVTFPFAFSDILSLLFGGYALWLFGASLERSWGARLYITFIVLANAGMVFLWTAGALLNGHVSGVVSGPWPMVFSIIVGWAWLNPEENIIFFILPMKAKWLGWLDIVILFFSFPLSHGASGGWVLLLGFFAMGGVAVAYLFAKFRRDWVWILRPKSRPQPSRRVIRHPSSTFIGALTRPYREWQRRRRIAYLQKTIHLDEEDAGQAK